MSWLNHQLLLLQEDAAAALAWDEAAVYFSLFSDSVFPYHLCITHKHEPLLFGVLHKWLEAENKATNSVQTSIEWSHGNIITHETYQKKYFLPDCMINEVLRQQQGLHFLFTTVTSAYNWI
jgi:hypothetical protein